MGFPGHFASSRVEPKVQVYRGQDKGHHPLLHLYLGLTQSPSTKPFCQPLPARGGCNGELGSRQDLEDTLSPLELEK